MGLTGQKASSLGRVRHSRKRPERSISWSPLLLELTISQGRREMERIYRQFRWPEDCRARDQRSQQSGGQRCRRFGVRPDLPHRHKRHRDWQMPVPDTANDHTYPISDSHMTAYKNLLCHASSTSRESSTMWLFDVSRAIGSQDIGLHQGDRKLSPFESEPTPLHKLVAGKTHN
jgi:hypothetical protein